MAEPLGIAVVGAGSIGIRGALDHLCLPDTQDKVFLAAVCDPAPGRAEAAARKYKVRRAYERYEDVLADNNVDLITLATPIGLHYEQGLAAVRAGKHTHFNKTMTTTAAEAEQLIREANERDVKLVASPGQMTQPQNRAIRRLIRQGALGRLAWATVGSAFGTYHENEEIRSGQEGFGEINPAWYWRKPGGGPLYDMTVYGLHTLTGILGPAQRVTAMSGVLIPQREYQGKLYPVDADDNTVILIGFEESLFAFAYGTAAGHINDEFGQPTFFGEKGTIAGSRWNGQPLKFPGCDDGLDSYQRGPHITGRHREMGEAHVFEDIMQLVDYVNEGTPPMGAAEHAAHVIEIIEAAYCAAETGLTQSLTTTFTPYDFEE